MFREEKNKFVDKTMKQNPNTSPFSKKKKKQNPNTKI